MASISIGKGFVASSTPIQEKNETSIFGSCRRNVPALVKHALSPIKELLPIKKIFSECLYELSKEEEDCDGSIFSHKNINNVVVRNLFADTSYCKSKSTLSSTEEDSGVHSLTQSFPDTDSETSHIESFCTLSGESNFTINDQFLEQSNFFLNLTNETSLLKLKPCVSAEIKGSSSISKHLTSPGKLNFDILRGLQLKNCFLILSQLLSYLSEEELCKVSSVSKTWNSIVVQDAIAIKRKKKFLADIKQIVSGPNKENRFSSNAIYLRDHKKAFNSMINIPIHFSEQPLHNKSSKTKHESFLEVGKMLESHEKLLKCPKCLYPSKCILGNKFGCTRSLCQFIFCNVCHGPYLEYHICSVCKTSKNVPSIIVGSKKSKRNLRRL